MRTEISGSLGSHLDRPIPFLSSHVRSLDISIQLKNQSAIGLSTTTANSAFTTNTNNNNNTTTITTATKTGKQLRFRTKMGPRTVTDRHLSLPATSVSASRSRSVSDRSDRSDDSEMLDSGGQQSGEMGSRGSRRRASKPKVRTGKRSFLFYFVCPPATNHTASAHCFRSGSLASGDTIKIKMMSPALIHFFVLTILSFFPSHQAASCANSDT